MLTRILCFGVFLFLISCASSADENLEAAAASASGAEYQLEVKNSVMPPQGEWAPVDTIYDDGTQIILLKVQSYSLNDSALVDIRRDTLADMVRVHRQIRHNGQIEFKLIDGDSTWHFYLNKMEFAGVISEDLVKTATPQIDIRAIDPDKSMVVLGANFCYPESQACDDGFALVDYRRRKVKFVAGHGGSSCGSGIEVVANSRVLTCEGLYDYSGRQLLKFEDYIVLAEPVQGESFLVLQAKYRRDSLENGLVAYTREKDLNYANARLYDRDGKLLKSFAYHAYSDEREYDAPMLRHKQNDAVFLLDFTQGRYTCVRKNGISEGRMQKRSQSPGGCTLYRIRRGGVEKDVAVSNSGNSVYLISG